MEKVMTIQEAGKELVRLGIEIGLDDPRSPLDVLAAKTTQLIGRIAVDGPHVGCTIDGSPAS